MQRSPSGVGVSYFGGLGPGIIEGLIKLEVGADIGGAEV